MKKFKKALYWAPRILSILFICFLALFSLDIFQPGVSASDIARGLFFHNIPSLILLILLVIAWKKEIVGAISYFCAGFFYVGFLIFGAVNSGIPWYLVLSWGTLIAGPAFIIGILFLCNWKNRTKPYSSTKHE